MPTHSLPPARSGRKLEEQKLEKLMGQDKGSLISEDKRKTNDQVIQRCPVLGQDRVNFCKKPGAGQLTKTGQTNRVFDTTCQHARFLVEDLAGRRLTGAWECASHQLVRESCSVLFPVLISIVVITVLSLCCSVTLPLSRPTSFTFFFRFSSPPQQGEGR